MKPGRKPGPQVPRAVVLPRGSRRAINDALRIAILALEGQEIFPMPSRRPHAAAKLRAVLRELIQRKIVHT